MTSISLLVVHPSAICRLGIEALLKGSGIRVIGQVSSGSEALNAALRHQPTAVLMAEQLADGDALDHAKTILEAMPSAKILILGEARDETHMARAAAIGITEFISDSTSVKGSRMPSLLQPDVNRRHAQLLFERSWHR